MRPVNCQSLDAHNRLLNVHYNCKWFPIPLLYIFVCTCPRPPLPRTHITLRVLKQRFLRILCHQVDKWRMQGAASSLTAIHGCSSVKPVKHFIGFYFLLDFQTSLPRLSRFIDCVMRRFKEFTDNEHASHVWTTPSNCAMQVRLVLKHGAFAPTLAK